MEIMPGQGLAAVLHTNGASDDAMKQALGAGLSIARRPDGKPEVPAEPSLNVSAAHAGTLRLAMAGRVRVGCDLEPVTARSPEDWQALLGDDRATLAQAIAHACREDADAACTRVWAVIECLKKAGFGVATPVRLNGPADGGWLVLEAAAARVATFVAVLPGGERVAIGLLAGASDAGL
jgi:enediyne polyketide synthase